MKQENKNKGFTLVEMIVVIVIIGILLAILVPGLFKYIKKAKDQQALIECRAVVTAAQAEALELSGKNKFIPYVIDKLRKGEPLNVSPCEQKRDFIYVDDFAEDIHGLLKNYKKCEGEIVNVSSGNSISLKTIIEFYKMKLNSISEIHYGALPYRKNESMDLRCDIGKLMTIMYCHSDMMLSFNRFLKL